MKRTAHDFFDDDFDATGSPLDESIRSLPLSTRVWRVLQKLGVQRLGDLVKLTEKDLKDAEGLGEKSLQEIKSFVQDMNLDFAPRREGGDV